MTENRPPLNGATLVAALPNFNTSRAILSYNILVDVGHAFCVSSVLKLTDPTWGQGYYFGYRSDNEHSRAHALDKAINFAYVRAGLSAMPWSEIEADVRDHPGHF